MSRIGLLALAMALVFLGPSRAAEPVRSSTPGPIAVFDLGEPAGRREISAALRAAGVTVLDSGLVDAAARGSGFSGSINLSCEDARRLASVVGASALVMGTLTVRERESDNGTRFADAFLALLLVDGATGRLLRYSAARGDGASSEEATGAAVAVAREEVGRWDALLADAARRRETEGNAFGWDPSAVDMLANPEGGAGLVPPRFFKRPAPKYTDDAERAQVVATVDLVVQFNANGTYGPIEVARWAGFGLDEAAVEAVRAATFWPARRDGRPITARALLRYNFRFRNR